MNTGRHVVTNKRIYKRSDLDPLLVRYLERWSGGKLEKLRLISPLEQPPFYRWRLEGINNISYKNNTGNKLSLLHSAWRLPLQEFFGQSLLHVGTEMTRKDLILDFREIEDIFDRINQEAYETYKDLPPYDFRSKEEKLIRIPYINILA